MGRSSTRSDAVWLLSVVMFRRHLFKKKCTRRELSDLQYWQLLNKNIGQFLVVMFTTCQACLRAVGGHLQHVLQQAESYITEPVDVVGCVWNVMAHAHKPDFVFRRNGRVHLNRRGRQFSRLMAVEVCASAVVMLDTPCSEVVWRVLATHSIRQFPLYFPSRASPCAITFQLDSTFHGRVCRLYERFPFYAGHRIQYAKWILVTLSPQLVYLPNTHICNKSRLEK